jgi:hypothetical protein
MFPARENTSWGYLRIVNELHKLGIDTSATFVRQLTHVTSDRWAPWSPAC